MDPLSPLRRIALGALFVALGILIPVMFHAVGLGSVFLPMHIPILMCGFFCGPAVGFTVGFVTPLLSAVFTGMPPLMPPVAQGMMLELATYGLVTALLYQRTKLGVYPVLILAMGAGRLVYGLLGFSLLPLFGLQKIHPLFPLTYGLLRGIPGVVIQLLLIPTVVSLMERSPHVLFVKTRRTMS